MFTHGWKNYYTFGGVIIELFLAFFVICCPDVNHYVFLSTPIWGVQMLCFLASGSFLWIYGEARKWYSRKHPNSYIATNVNW